MMLGYDSNFIRRMTILQNTPFFAQLSPNQLESVTQLSQIISHAKNDTLYHLGSNAYIFYVLMHGMINFAIGHHEMATTAGQILHPGEVFGWAALIERAPQRIATATCLTDCLVLAIDGQGLLLLMDQDHDIGFEIMKHLNNLITNNLTAFAAG
jgi:CRP-like cAMP-binding protein